MEVVISPKYQVVIPKQIREALKLKKNQKLALIVKNGVISLIPIPSLEELKGIAKGIEIKEIREEGERI
ncbi:AbrB family transcriptional regulator [Candidatus Aerophobetes bacterium]|uniref:AbrB family transcriptional regulator n=1 Tax=Aerophobetes bacterium TaxID=2030807 RepID=A0A662D9B5_UNCAE|nr:MAG: AbrB family transcriptional regulator [Candidatus Aerophobetes bacterium]